MEVVAPNEWTQIDDWMLHTQMTPGGILVAGTPTSATPAGAAAVSSGPSTAGARAPMERPPAPPGLDGQALRCPRCDSSNTKFCYYNNYSLSQPRHFCKACKRYWTRGGTLRNVPVGGGCRKNKRVKKPHPNAATTTSSSSTDPSPPMPSLPFLPNPPTMVSASSDLGLLLYSLANPASVPSSTTTYETISEPCSTPYDHLQPQLGARGLSFPSNPEANYFHGVKTHAHLAAAATAASPLQECSIFGSAAASLLASSLKQQQQHKPVQNPNDPSPYGGLHAPAAGWNLPALLKDVKLEGGDAEGIMSSSNHRNMLEWQFPSCENNPMEAIATESSSLYWNAAAAAFGGSVWPDAASFGPSVAPLI